MKLRRIVFWMHLAAGLIAGLVVAIMSVTGMLLAFEEQITQWMERDLRATSAEAATPRLPIDTLIAAFRASEPKAEPTAFTLRSDPAAPLAINLGRERTAFLNPHTAALLGEGSKSARQFFRSVTNLHRWLGAPDENRAAGRAITGACNLAFLFLVASGFYLWWPRKWTLSAGRAILLPKLGLRGKARDFNWHNAVGFWSAPILFLIVLSGVIMSYQWANDLLYRLTRSEPPPARTAPARPAGPSREKAAIPNDIDRLVQIATAQVPDWLTIGARFESSPPAPVTFSIEQGQRGRPDLRSQLTINPATGEVVRWEHFSSYSLGRQLRSWARFAHTGEAGGTLGQTIAALASAAATILVWTGFSLAWRRFRGPKREASL